MYTVLNLGWEPARFANLPQKDKAFVIASIEEKIRQQQEAQRRAKMSKGRKGR